MYAKISKCETRMLGFVSWKINKNHQARSGSHCHTRNSSPKMCCTSSRTWNATGYQNPQNTACLSSSTKIHCHCCFHRRHCQHLCHRDHRRRHHRHHHHQSHPALMSPDISNCFAPNLGLVTPLLDRELLSGEILFSSKLKISRQT